MKKNKNTKSMVMRYPATRWQDALPAGSGVVGALVYGNIEEETIVLNHDALYYPTPPPEIVDVSDKLSEMRQLIQDGKYRESAILMRNTYDERRKTDKAGGLAPYQPFCSIHMSATTDGPFQNYRRGVDFDTGLAWVKWNDNNTAITREVFVSRQTDTVYLRVKSSKPGLLNCSIALEKTRSEQVDENSICHSSLRNTEPESKSSASGSNRIIFRAGYPNGFNFGALGVLDVSGGSFSNAEDSFLVKDADELVFRVKLYLGEDSEKAVSRISAEFDNDDVSFDDAFAAHEALHSELFNRVSLKLGETERLCNEDMLMAAYGDGVSTPLLETMFDFGRYLLICSSREGGLPANLQGIWNGDYSPAWNCDFHTDENIQMNYWAALSAGLDETLLPFFNYFESYMDDFRQNAKNNYACRGIQLPLAMTMHGRANPHIYGAWTAAAGWIGQHFYDYFQYTGDLDFLRNHVVPWLKEVALFYEDFLIEGDDGKLLFVPSVSPENRPSNCNSLMSMNATMDVAVCREVLTNLCHACEILEIEAEGIIRWQNMLDQMPEYQVNEDGALREWLHPAFDDNYHHRHQSHLYPLFPGLEITKESDPEIFEACKSAVDKRLIIGLTSQTGWSMAHMANIYARLENGERALECLEILLRGSTGPNLFTYHNDWRKMGLSCSSDCPPFQIDANFGITAAILEMLVFSKPGLIKLFPAIPEKWSAGNVSGIRCRGGITLDMEWDRKSDLFIASITSNNDYDVRIYLPGKADDYVFTSEETVIKTTIENDDNYRDFVLKKGTALKIEKS